MARLPRLVAPGLPHLIIHRGHNGQAVFLDEADCSLYRQSLSESAASAGVALHGYSLLPAEVRLLATPADESALGSMMQGVGRSFVRAFNLRHRRSGTPWEGRFRSTVVEPENHFLPCLRFAEAIGLAGMGIAQASSEALWSSASHHVGSNIDLLITEHTAFWDLGNTPFEREAAYRRFISLPMAHDVAEAIAAAALKGWALGSVAFAARIGAQIGRRTRPLDKGRPRLNEAGSPHGRGVD